jgi:mannose-1-phosphate guanylyltransferase
MQASVVASIPPDHFLAEPLAKNTAAAIGLAAIALNRKDPEAVMVVMPADHVILKNSVFARAVREGSRLAKEGWFVTLGIKAAHPETGYGYIRRGRPLSGRSNRGPVVYQVSRFTEKPDRATAKRYVSDGRYYWNSGIFLWRAATILSAIARHLPEHWSCLEAIRGALGTPEEGRVLEVIFPRMRRVSVDVGILERSTGVYMIPATFLWDDVGAWSALGRVLTPDENGNTVIGRHVGRDSHGCIVYGTTRPIGTIGLNDLVVVETPEGVLVCPKERAQEVKDLVRSMREAGT